MKRFIILLLLLQPFLIFGQEKYSLLFLVSYDSSFPTFNLQYDGILSVFDNSSLNVEVHVEFLDSKRFAYDDVKQGVYESLLYKIDHSSPFDYIISADDNALRFVLEYTDQLFSDTPVVFFGVNDIDLAYSQNRNPYVSGFIETISYLDTLSSIKSLLPEAEDLYILYDSTTSGTGDYNRIKQINSTIDSLDIHYLSLSEMTFAGLYSRVSRLSVKQPILLLSAYVDKSNSVLSFDESVSRLTANSAAPVFHLWGHGIGEGLIGGKVADHRFYAELSARFIIDLINGKRIQDTEVSNKSNNRFLFDYAVLEKFGLNSDLLSEDSVLINREKKFSRHALWVIIILSTVIALLSMVLLVIFKIYRLKILAEKKVQSMYTELEKEKEFLSITLQSIGDGVLATDHNGTVTFINHIAEELTEWSNEEACGKPLDEIFHIVNEYTNELCENPARKVIRTGETIQLANHTCLISRNGKRIVIEDSAAPINDRNNNIFGVIIVFRDSTEKIKMRDSINKSQKLEALGVLAGGIAHDFNNYLAGVLGYIELALSNLEKEGCSRIVQYLTNVLDVSEKAKALTQQLLTFSKGGGPNLKVSNIRKTIKHSVNFALSGSRVIPELLIDDDLWNCKCDVNQIAQCIDNLVINGIQAMPEGGTLFISARNTTTDLPESLTGQQYLCITISDKGSGIPPHIMSKIFDPFFTTKQTGHGLGLATVFSIIKHHDGLINVESEPGKGTTFHIYLPAELCEIQYETINNTDKYIGSGLILVLDDQEYIIDIMSEMLRELGYQPITATSGKKAIEIVRKDFLSARQIRACILDLTLPGDLSGDEIARQIKNISPSIPLVASSGYADSPVLSDPMKYHFIDSITKPFTLQRVADVLEQL